MSGRPLLIHEADPNLTLDKKDEAKYLEMLALGSALSSVQVLSAFQKDMPVGPVVSVMQRWYWDLMAVLSGAEPSIFRNTPKLINVRRRVRIFRSWFHLTKR